MSNQVVFPVIPSNKIGKRNENYLEIEKEKEEKEEDKKTHNKEKI
jgi:hypothetical protein